jgi:hypothetical protein
MNKAFVMKPQSHIKQTVVADRFPLPRIPPRSKRHAVAQNANGNVAEKQLFTDID